MSIVCQKPVCSRGCAKEVVVAKSGFATCTKCGQRWYPKAKPEPTYDELKQDRDRLRKFQAYLDELGNDKEYEKLVNDSLDRINREKAYIEKLRTNREKLPHLYRETTQSIDSLNKQMEQLIQAKAAETRGPRQASTKLPLGDRLRLKLGDPTYAKMRQVMSDEEIETMFK